MGNHIKLHGKNDIKGYLDQLIEKDRIPGIQYLVMSKDKILFEYNGGWQDIRNKIPVTDATTFMLNSSTKPITAAAILQLMEKGEIDLDSNLSSYYPHHPYGDDVTVRHLLTHNAGIADPVPINWFHLAEEHEGFDENRALAEILKNSKSKSRPGKKYRYSNIGYWLLGKIIEAVSGMDYPDYVRKYIIQALSIPPNEMDFCIPNIKLQAKEYQKKFSLFNLIIYFIGDNKIRAKSEGSWSSYQFICHNGYSYGGLYASARGVSRFLQDMLKELPVIFGLKTKMEFFSPQTNDAGETYPLIIDVLPLVKVTKIFIALFVVIQRNSFRGCSAYRYKVFLRRRACNVMKYFIALIQFA